MCADSARAILVMHEASDILAGDAFVVLQNLQDLFGNFGGVRDAAGFARGVEGHYSHTLTFLPHVVHRSHKHSPLGPGSMTRKVW